MDFRHLIRLLILHFSTIRECVSTGAAGARTRRSLEHHLLHPLILRPRALFYRTDGTRRTKFLTHALIRQGGGVSQIKPTTLQFLPTAL